MNNQDRYDKSWYLVKRLGTSYVRPLLKRFMLATMCMLIVAATTAASAWLIQPALDSIFVNKNKTMLYIIPAAIVINALINGLAEFYESTIMRRIGQKIASQMQLDLYKNLIFSDLKFISRYSSGNLISRFINDINTLKKTTTEIFTNIVEQLFTLLALFGLMLYQNYKLALLTIIIFPLAFFPIAKLGRRMRSIARNMQEKMSDFTSRVDETFQNIRVIKSYCRELYEISRVENVLNHFLKIYKKASYIEAAPSPLMGLFGAVAVALIILYGGLQGTTPGTFLSFIVALLLAYKPLKSLSKLNAIMQEGLAAARRLFIILDVTPQIRELGNEKLTKNDFNIEFADVCFSYKPKRNILNRINMKIPKGKTVALVGASGEGKTTILNLLQRFYDPDSGVIKIGNIDIKKIKFKSLRENIAFVSQEINLFDNSLMENIRYGKLEASDEKVLDASMAAAAHDFIMELPKKYNTFIGPNGAKLSAGQRQRISIARAILKNAPILLLDEATSALDAISESKVQIALEYLKKGRTTMIIAHKLSTIETADIIFMIANGQIVETGTHNELVLNNGHYNKLYQQYKADDTLLKG